MKTTNSLDRKLDQYSSTAKGQITHSWSIGEVAGYAAAAGAGLAMASAADAAIIYSGVQNVMVSIDPTLQATAGGFTNTSSTAIDIDGGGADLNLFAVFQGRAYATSTAKYLGGALADPVGGAALLGTGGAVGASNLPASTLIGPGGNFYNNLGGQARIQYIIAGTPTSSTNYGQFAPGTTGFLGIQLASGNFGWIRLRVDDLGPNQPFTTLLAGIPAPPIGNGLNYSDKVTAIDWAYDNSGAPIRAGDIPAPSPLALLAAGAVGIAAFRRRKAEQPVH